MEKMLIILLVFSVSSACSKGGSQSDGNRTPVVSLTESLVGVQPFTFDFAIAASDVDGDPLTYSWDFGEGTKREGKAKESFTYPANGNFRVFVTVSDGKTSVKASVDISTKQYEVVLDDRISYQQITGFGGFGAQNVYWGDGPFSTPRFISDVVDDLGLTIARDEVPTNFEFVNDNNDPLTTNLSAFNIDKNLDGYHQPLLTRINYMKALKAAGVKTFISTVWSPPVWMKHNQKLGNGTQNQNSAPAFNPNPDGNTNQLRSDMYAEFAEMLMAYVRIIKREADVDLYAISIQNEPRFSQFYASCVYNGGAMRDLMKVVGKRFRDEGIATRLFLPEDIGWLQGVESMVKPTLDDPEARQYADIVAVHGYDLDGITASSPGAQTWKTMYGWGAAYGKPLWMTETSGYANNLDGALELARAMTTALKHGNVSAWVFWSLSGTTVDEYCLMSAAGQKSKRFYASKNFYRYIRPGCIRIEASSPESDKIYTVAFKDPVTGKQTTVVINDDAKDRAVFLKGTGVRTGYDLFVTSATKDCAAMGTSDASKGFVLPARSVLTLQSND